MPAAEIAAAITSLSHIKTLAQTMVGLRDAEAMRAKSVELLGAVLESLNKAIEAREAQSAQLDSIRALEAEISRLKAWNTEKEEYELLPVGLGSVVFMLKPNARGTKAPHWLCPTCFENDKKSFFQPKGNVANGLLYECISCKSTIIAKFQETPQWQD